MHKVFDIMPPLDTVEGKVKFAEWCKQMEIYVAPSVEIAQLGAQRGKGIVAKADIKSGTVILHVPQKALLSPNDTLSGSQAVTHIHSPVVPLLDQHLRKSVAPNVTNATRLALRLMSEVSRRRHSPWFTYISALPIMSTSLFRAYASQPELVAGTGVGMCLAEKDFVAQWELVKDFVASQPTAFASPLNTQQLFLQCAAQVASRNFNLEHHEGDNDIGQDTQFLKLIPVVDFINHSSDAEKGINVIVRLRGGRGRAPLVLEVESSREIKSGEEILFSYGAGVGAEGCNDAKYLAEFQFLPQDRPLFTDSVRISQTQLIDFCHNALASTAAAAAAKSSQQPAVISKKEMAERLNLLDNANLVFREGVFVIDKPPANNNEKKKEEEEGGKEIGAAAAAAGSKQGADNDDASKFEIAGQAAGDENETWAAVALLTMGSEEFNGQPLSKWWRCDRSDPKLRAIMKSVLAQRREIVEKCAERVAAHIASLQKESSAAAPAQQLHSEDALTEQLASLLLRQYDAEKRMLTNFCV